MLIVGLLLIIAAAALTVGLVVDGGETATPEVLGVSWTTNVAGVFFAGVATAFVFLLGVWLMKHTAARARKRRMERKETKHRQQDSVRGLEEERSALRSENEKMAEELAKRRSAAESAAATGSRDGAATGSKDGADGYTENRKSVIDHERDRSRDTS